MREESMCGWPKGQYGVSLGRLRGAASWELTNSDDQRRAERARQAMFHHEDNRPLPAIEAAMRLDRSPINNGPTDPRPPYLAGDQHVAF